ncbi:hypothetical protein KR018_001319 [Drosophila ironensis]|nr:hypothetical protein KR018_001319 [Drosophila ironensis]
MDLFKLQTGYTAESDKPLVGECQSTGYYPDIPWVAVKKRKLPIKEPRGFFKDMRTNMYKEAEAEKCHVPEMRNVLEFLECQIRRHMRLEMLIPQYPNIPN